MATLIRCDRCGQIFVKSDNVDANCSKLTIDDGVNVEEFDLCLKCAKNIIAYIVKKPETFAF